MLERGQNKIGLERNSIRRLNDIYNMIDIKLVVTDIDGVWTDGGLYFDNHGNEFKKFNVRDGAATLLLRTLKIPICIITGKDTKIVKNRAKSLKIDYLYQGIDNKYSKIKGLCKKLNIKMSEVAYIGDDFNDVKMLRAAGISASPSNASDYIKKEATWTLNSRGGEGAFREFVEKILQHFGVLEETVEKLLEGYS